MDVGASPATAVFGLPDLYVLLLFFRQKKAPA